MAQQLDPKAMGYVGAVLGAICMVLFPVLAAFGVYTGAVGLMNQWMMFSGPGVAGFVGGLIEGVVLGFIIGWLIAKLYNAFATR